MSSLDLHLENYLALRRSLGYRLEEHGRVLPGFVRYAHANGERTVHTETAIAWAAGAGSDCQRARRLSMVRGLARYLVAFEAGTEVPPRGLLAAGEVRSAPHIFSDQEIAQLMGTACALGCAPFGAAIATLIGLMASTGLRPGEMRRLDRGDVDLAAGQLTVWHSKLGRSRRLPLHESTIRALADYSLRRDQAHPHPPDQAAFFLTKRGRRLTRPVLCAAFRQLRAQAELTTGAVGRPALLGDLRHTFAVNTLIGWHQAGVDVQRQLPVLSAYMGHVNPAQTYWYLQATPELMALIAERLERFWEAER